MRPLGSGRAGEGLQSTQVGLLLALSRVQRLGRGQLGEDDVLSTRCAHDVRRARLLPN